MRSHGKARERNGLTEGSLENSEMREFEEDRSRLAAFCSPQRNRNNDSNENSSWQRDWRGNPGRGKKAWQELGIFPTWGKLCVTFFFFFFLVGLKEIMSSLEALLLEHLSLGLSLYLGCSMWNKGRSEVLIG